LGANNYYGETDLIKRLRELPTPVTL
jgi:hypothetical protein